METAKNNTGLIQAHHGMGNLLFLYIMPSMFFVVRFVALYSSADNFPLHGQSIVLVQCMTQ